MSNSIETLVYDEVEGRMNEMAELKPTDEAYKATADVTLKFIDKATKMKELEIQEEANKLKREELEENKKRRVGDMILKVVDTAVKVGVPAVLAVALTIYEQTDSTTSTPTKEYWKKIFRVT